MSPVKRKTGFVNFCAFKCNFYRYAEVMCALTVLAGMRPTPTSNDAFAWKPPVNSFRDGGMEVFRDPNVYSPIEGMSRLRLVWPDPTPEDKEDWTCNDNETHPEVEGEYVDVLKYLRLWDGK